MGNLSNPLVNRWGLNLFWYQFWFNDKNYNLSSHTKYILEEIILIFVNFEFFFSKNIFISKYWYKNFFFQKKKEN